jgi:hypothetical protein
MSPRTTTMYCTLFPGILLVVLLLHAPAHADEITADPFARIEQQLAVVTSLHLTNVPLNEALDTLGNQVGMQFVIDREGLKDLGLQPDEVVSISVDNVSLELILDMLLKQSDLTYIPRGGAVMVTSDEQALTQLFVRVYPVPDLIGAAQPQTDYGHDYDTLIDTIISIVDADTWVDNGGPEAEIRPFPYASAIVVSQTFQSHRKIERLLSDLRRLRTHQGLPIVSDRTISTTRVKELPTKTYVTPASAGLLPHAYGE